MILILFPVDYDEFVSLFLKILSHFHFHPCCVKTNKLGDLQGSPKQFLSNRRLVTSVYQHYVNVNQYVNVNGIYDELRYYVTALFSIFTSLARKPKTQPLRRSASTSTAIISLRRLYHTSRMRDIHREFGPVYINTLCCVSLCDARVYCLCLARREFFQPKCRCRR